ncbi:serine/threonine-protein kinase [Sandaracinus amylolyticus]|uniref:Serine/threonine protein kinase PrkC, regulator of stationary phase n=1 Tax=Sandaracinus amylolyticus TaxID=927083 RepID=A0A0F6SHT4_9BACT|nr:serine/threonine-protein kinase [Sandaracinus amylolyticus]AKF10999.1 Serine/threonine protein kinase PrkC, regulator of stationary phase [Sandaracinus amylolyticus]
MGTDSEQETRSELIEPARSSLDVDLGASSARWQHTADVSRARVGFQLALACTVMFSVCDIGHVIVLGGDLVGIWSLRAMLIAWLASAMVRMRRKPPVSERELEFWVMGSIYAIVGTISAMMLFTGGLDSYYGTANLILLGGAGYVPRPWRRTAPAVLLAVLLFPAIVLGGVALVPELRPQLSDDARLYRFFVLTLLFAASGVFGIGGAHLVYVLRRELGQYRSIGRYRLRRRLGRGGMGEVWAAWHKGLGREVAVKMLRYGHEVDPIAVERFRREVRATSELSHPNTVRVFDYGATEDGILYYAMEILEGENLRTLVRREGPLPPARAVHLISQAARALAEAHRKGIVHRDVKPENVFVVDAGGERDFVKILDFGIAKVLGATPGEDGLTRTGVVTGTPATMSPEAITASEIGPPADVYALGAVLYFALAGRFPFEGEPASQLVAHLHERVVPPSVKAGADVPHDVEAVVLRALEKDPAHRYRCADALAKALAATSVAGRWTPPKSVPPPRSSEPRISVVSQEMTVDERLARTGSGSGLGADAGPELDG